MIENGPTALESITQAIIAASQVDDEQVGMNLTKEAMAELSRIIGPENAGRFVQDIAVQLASPPQAKPR